MTSRDDSEFDRNLTSTLQRMAPEPRNGLLSRVTTAVVATRQHPRWLAFADRAWFGLDWPRVVAVAAVAVVALVAGVAIGTSGLMRTGDTKSPTPESTGSSIAPFAEWTRNDLPDPAPDVYGGATPNDVVAFGGGYVAVGTVDVSCCADGDPSENRGVVWTSADGSAWKVRDDLLAFEHAMLNRLVTDGSRLLAVGSYAEPRADEPGLSVPALWVSTDGFAWERVPDPVPSVVAAGGDGFVGASVGQMRSTGDAFTTFMTSSDGIAWIESSANWAGLILDMAIAPDGRVVAVGAINTAGLEDAQAFDAIAWASIDGTTWSRPETVTAHARMSSIAYHDGRFFAIATGDGLTDEGPRVDVIWSSTDGVSWTQPAIPLTSLAREETLGRIFSLSVGVLAVGARDVGGISNATAWFSLDGGVSWSRVSPDAFSGVNNEIASVIPVADGLLAVGRRWDPRTSHPLPQVWVAPR